MFATNKRKGLAMLGAVLMLSSLLSGLAIPAFSAEPNVVSAEVTNLNAEITKRTEWTDEENGDGQVTLRYASNSGSESSQKNLNVILIQDKSGSMDCNYAYNLESIRSHWVDEGENSNKLAEIYYPIQNVTAYSEDLVNDIARDPNYESRIKTATYYRYCDLTTGVWSDYPYVQEISPYFSDTISVDNHFIPFDFTVTVDGSSYNLIADEGYFNAPCNLNGHYYLLVRDVALSGNQTLPAYSMVEGQLLNSIWDTDKHEYELLPDRDTALDYLAQGRRVVKISKNSVRRYFPANSWNSEELTLEAPTVDDDLYFLDISTLVLHEKTQRTQMIGDKEFLREENRNYPADHLYDIYGWYLETSPSVSCQDQDRLSLSQKFALEVVEQISEKNPNNKIAYIPFWGDVPIDGKWENSWVADYGDSGDNNIKPEDTGVHFGEYPGVTRIGFTQGKMEDSDYEAIESQIADDFTYDGTNWTRAFQAASDILDARTEADKQTETLVIFLTDGNPTGSKGSTNDNDNAYINGNVTDGFAVDGKPIGYSALMSHEGVTVISVGVGVALGDSQLVDRLDNIDTTVDPNTGRKARATIARTNEELANLTNTVMDRVTEMVYHEILGLNAFYADQLSGPFTLDESKISSEDWEILQSADSETVYGVPANVYNAAQNGKKYVYVQDSKTVYWYIGDMTNGDFTADGHELVFPITYSDYNVSTGGADKIIASNTRQTLTYVTTKNRNEVQSVMTETPSIIFNRSDGPAFTVEKAIATSYDTDQTYRYVYSTTRQESGQVTDYTGVISVTIKAGKKEGSATVQGVEPGTYYVYEVDQNNNIISTQINTVTLSRNAEITTVAYSETVPHSATASDNTQLANRNNVLTIVSTNGLASFVDNTTSVSVEKTWDDNDYENRPESVTVSLLRNGTKVNEMVLTSQDNWQGTFDNLPAADAQGNEYEYTVTEEEIIGYQSQITETQDNHFVIENTLLKSTIHINKYDTDGKTTLAGVTFEIRNSNGDLVDSKTTGSDGKIDFPGLMPNTYVLTETSTVDGMSLLPEPITVTMPMVMTEQEIIDNNVDTSKCVYYNESGTYLVCEITYSVTNSANLDMPASGSDFNPWIWFTLMGGLLWLGAATVLLLLQLKKTHR